MNVFEIVQSSRVKFLNRYISKNNYNHNSNYSYNHKYENYNYNYNYNYNLNLNLNFIFKTRYPVPLFALFRGHFIE